MSIRVTNLYFVYRNTPQSMWVHKEGGVVWFPLKAISNLLGYSWKGASMLRRVPKAWWKIIEEADQDTIFVSTDGLDCFLSRSLMDGARDLLQCLTTEAHELPEGTTYKAPKDSTSVILAEHENLITQHTSDIQELKQQLNELRRDRQASLKRLSELPPPSVEVPDLSLRVLIGRTVREYAKANGLTTYENLWNKLYMEFRDIYHVDLKVIAGDRGVHVLDLAEEREYLPQMYALAVKLFKNRLVSPTGSITLQAHNSVGS